ncbi:MAG: hypothetical protein K5705_08290 [Oscillospiraceae bacterium]|nr:hypothetical protein [Oscillospiraceae bacterium]
MICKQCGSQIFDHATSCPFCSAAVGGEQESAPAPSAQNMPDLSSAMPDLSGVMPDLTMNPQAQSPVPPSPAPEQTAPVQPTAPPQSNPFGSTTVQPTAPQSNPFGSTQPNSELESMLSPMMPTPPAAEKTDAAPQPAAFAGAGMQQPAAAGATTFSEADFAGLPPAKTGFLAGVPMRMVGKIAIAIALVCFFLPFVTVSCSTGTYGTEQVLGTFTGMQLIAGNLEYDNPNGTTAADEDEGGSTGNDSVFDFNSYDWFAGMNGMDSSSELSNTDAASKQNYYVLAAMILGAAALILLFIKGRKLEIISGILSGLSALLVLSACGTFKSYYELTANEETAEFIKIHARYGLILCVLCFGIGAFAAFREHKDQFY